MAELNLTEEAREIVAQRVREAVGSNRVVAVTLKHGPPAIQGDTVVIRT